jgi:hypothetical protein
MAEKKGVRFCCVEPDLKDESNFIYEALDSGLSPQDRVGGRRSGRGLTRRGD